MTTPDPDRPQPVVSAAKQVGLLVSAAFVAVGLAWFAITAGVSRDSLPSTAVAIGEAVTAVLALASYLLALWHGRHAAQQVTPLSSPLSVDCRPLMTVDQYASLKPQEPAAVAPPAVAQPRGDSWGHPVLKLGKRRTDPTRPVLAMGAHLTAKAFQAPAEIDYASHVAKWLLGRNTEFGTCGPTSVANLALLVSTMLAEAPVAFTDDEIIDLYRRSGNPDFDGKTRNPDGTYVGDNGVDMTVMLSELVKNGIGVGDRNVKALAFGKIDPHDTAELWAAACLFGGVLWGSDLDVAQQSQFDAGLWDYAPRSAQWGGHATLSAPAYSDKPGTVADRTKLITWATPIDATDGFITHQVTECYVVIFPWHVGDKLFCQALDLAGVAKEYEALTGRPFPAVQPDPDPGPAPAPVPPPAPGPAPGPGPAPAPVPEDVIAWAKRTLVHKSPSHADKHAAQDLLDWAAGR